MLISLKWIADFVDLPADLDPHALAERFTRTTAEVEGVERVSVGAKGLVAARVVSVTELPGTQQLRLVGLDSGKAPVQVVSGAPVLPLGWSVVFAAPGAAAASLGVIQPSKVAGHDSHGMILPGDALGVAQAAREAIFLDPGVKPGTSLDGELFDDWLIEIDNKSLTNRPDLWGHYGIAREIAAILGRPLKPYPVAALESITDDSKPAIPIDIADPGGCRRYTGLLLGAVPSQPAPLWMQLRLGRVGMRPITALVDLTNYIMADLGQPMHAFDADKVDRIEVARARDGEVFRTLDGMERRLTSDMLMIKSRGENVALAGLMGGLETEVSPSTTSLLLESANFEPTAVRKAATRLGLRTEASARFEKSLDPLNTVLAVRRFVAIARDMWPRMITTGRLSDAFPSPLPPISVTVNSKHISRSIGRTVPFNEAAKLLGPLGFELSRSESNWEVAVPSHRATNDVSIEADVIEEIARLIGYDKIEPVLPRVTMRRFEPHALREIERSATRFFCGSRGFHEIFDYLWYDAAWIKRIGHEPGPCVTLRNPAAEGCERLRTTLMPGVLAAVATNRFHFSSLSLLEVGSVFEVRPRGDAEHRHFALTMAQRGKRVEDDLYAKLKGAVESWLRDLLGRGPSFAAAPAMAERPWEDRHRTAALLLDNAPIGRIGVVDLPTRRAMDEHLGAWGIAWAEIRLDSLTDATPTVEPLGAIPEFPRVELDFSLVTPPASRYRDVVDMLQRFSHPLLSLVRYVGSYEGEGLKPGHRSLTFRTVIGDHQRTLTDADSGAFREAMEKHLTASGFEIRR